MIPKWLVYKNEKYETWIRSKFCLVCNTHPVDCHHVKCSRRNSYMSVPLCREHHSFGPMACHIMGHDSFEKKHNLDLNVEIIKLLMKFIHEKEIT